MSDRVVTKGDGLSLIILAAGQARRYGGCKPLAPVGVNGEAVIDLLAGDAIEAGFERLVLVVNPQSGDEIRSHVAARWPSTWPVSFCVQDHAEGTASAVAVGTGVIEPGSPFGVANGDDVYGLAALTRLATHLRLRTHGCLVGFYLENTVIGECAVSRGVCRINSRGLYNITERVGVARSGSTFSCDDGAKPATLSGREIVSMNLWGFSPAMRARFVAAAKTHNYDVCGEARLPDVVKAAIDEGARFDVLLSDDLCIGVTHYEDLKIARSLICNETAAGRRVGALSR